MDLSICLQEELDAIVLSLNALPRKTLGWKSPFVGYTEHMAWLQLQADSIHSTPPDYVRFSTLPFLRSQTF
jgi:hypothetical protein